VADKPPKSGGKSASGRKKKPTAETPKEEWR
jgi:hypothetical protein